MKTQKNNVLDTELMTDQQAAFLAHYAENGVVQRALNAAGVSRATLRKWKEDEEFDSALTDARLASVETAEEELRRRGMGYEDPVIFQGQPIYKRDPNTGKVLLDEDFNPVPFTVKKRSDRLLEVYMKANDGRYKDKSQVEHTGEGGGPVEAEITVRYVLPDGKTAADYDKGSKD